MDVIVIDEGYLVLSKMAGAIIVDCISAYPSAENAMEEWLDSHPSVRLHAVHLVNGWDEADELLSSWM